MDTAQAAADGLEALEAWHDPLPGVGEAGRAPRTGWAGSGREKPLAHGKITCGKRSPEQRLLSSLRVEEY